MTKNSKYPKPMIFIHWFTVILLITIFLLGKNLENHEFNELNFNYYRAHALTGMLLFITTIIRLFLRNKYKNVLPEEIKYYSPIHKILVRLVTKLIYVFLILTPLFGFIMIFKTGALQADLGGDFPVGAHFNETLEFLHKTSIFSLLSLVFVHIVGVIAYKFKTGENLVLKKMCIRSSSKDECK